MAAPCSLIVDPTESGYYHCVSRCVRRAFLCGYDRLLERDFLHRKQWIEDRIAELAQLSALAYVDLNPVRAGVAEVLPRRSQALCLVPPNDARRAEALAAQPASFVEGRLTAAAV
jgi:hypothetical protein